MACLRDSSHPHLCLNPSNWDQVESVRIDGMWVYMYSLCELPSPGALGHDPPPVTALLHTSGPRSATNKTD